MFGLISIASGIACFFLPETLHENLPQTFADGDVFGLDMRFFSLAKRKGEQENTDDSDGATDLACVMTTLLPSGEKENDKDRIPEGKQ